MGQLSSDGGKVTKLPEHLEELHRQEQAFYIEEMRDPEFWMTHYRKLDEDQAGVSLGDLFRAVKRLLLVEADRCKQKKFEGEEHG